MDEYGEVIDMAMWVRHCQIMEEEAKDKEATKRKRWEEEVKVTELSLLLTSRTHRLLF